MSESPRKNETAAAAARLRSGPSARDVRLAQFVAFVVYFNVEIRIRNNLQALLLFLLNFEIQVRNIWHGIMVFLAELSTLAHSVFATSVT